MKTERQRKRQRELSGLWYQRHREEVLQKVAEYSRAHPEVNREASRRYRARNGEKRRDTILRYRYKLSAADFDAMVLGQDGKCRSCGEKTSRFYVDHDHRCCSGTPTCGKCTRGLLCSGCNVGDRLSLPWKDKIGRLLGSAHGAACA